MAFKILKNITKVDSQIQEIISRNLVINKLIDCEFEVALPIRDNGIDFLVYKQNSIEKIKTVQLKSSILSSISFNKKYLKFKKINFIFLMNIKSKTPRFYGFTLDEILTVLSENKKEYTKKGGIYWKFNSDNALKIINKYEITEDQKFIDFFTRAE